MRMFEPRPEWQRHARCLGYAPEIFFGFPAERPNKRARREAVARELCNGCSARPGCGGAGRDEPFGIWGGLTAAERGFSDTGNRIASTPQAEARAA